MSYSCLVVEGIGCSQTKNFHPANKISLANVSARYVLSIAKVSRFLFGQFSEGETWLDVTGNFAHKEMTHMQCASCGRKIKREPVWVDGEPYCSQDCADMGPAEKEGIESKEEEKW
ncbi:MAG: hypothetical protein AMJ91_06875 [candidate division Zixibacteria bacterium SM23_73_3]|nr:MAG: hypothetical protein AMJ91_06875 [candidate division Zixibacteria bacterium SM23_73_3]